MQERSRSLLAGGALAIYGGLAWLGCIAGGVVTGVLINGDPDSGTTQGGSHGIGQAVPEILMSTTVLLAVAYGLFLILLRRQR